MIWLFSCLTDLEGLLPYLIKPTCVWNLLWHVGRNGFGYPISEQSRLLTSSLIFLQLKLGMLCSFCPYQFVVHVHSSRQFEHQRSECLLYLLWRLGMYRVLPLVYLMDFYVFSGSSTTTATTTTTTAAIAICTTWVLWSKCMKHSLFCALNTAVSWVYYPYVNEKFKV